MGTPIQTPAVCSSVLARSLLTAGAGADARRLARDARIPSWVLVTEEAMVPSRNLMRLWELCEHVTADPYIALTMAARYKLSELGLYDYLFTTAATLQDGMQASIDFVHLVSTCSRVAVESVTDREITYSCRPADAGGRGAVLGSQFCVAAFCARARAGTGMPVTPVRVEFAHQAPRSYRAFTDAFGTRRIDFGAPVTAVSFHTRDLGLPMPDADARLARILRRFATSLPAPPSATWREQFQQVLDDAIGQGIPSLEAVARRLAMSPRTLQRRLAEQDTTWRAELDSARQRRVGLGGQDRVTDMSRLARQLGYAGPRSARRALRRWDNLQREEEAGRADPE